MFGRGFETAVESVIIQKEIFSRFSWICHRVKKAIACVDVEAILPRNGKCSIFLKLCKKFSGFVYLQPRRLI